MLTADIVCAFCGCYWLWSCLITLQEVPVSSYLRDEYASVECTHCCSAYSHTSAVVFLYDNIDTYNEHFQLDMKCSCSVVIIVVLVKSPSVSLRGLRESVKQFADGLPDGVIANGVVINVSWVSVQELWKRGRFCSFVPRIVRVKDHTKLCRLVTSPRIMATLCSKFLVIMAALCNRGAIVFLPCSFFLLSIFFFFPRLISAAGDWMSTILPHMVWP